RPPARYPAPAANDGLRLPDTVLLPQRRHESLRPGGLGRPGLIIVLLLVKIGTKFAGVWPLTRAFRFSPRDGNYITLLMSTGLTFGTISALFGLNNGHIDRDQYTALVTVVIASAIVPTLIAQAFFRPTIEPAVVVEIESPARLWARLRGSAPMV